MSYRFRRSTGRFFPTKFDTRRMDKDMRSYQEQFGTTVLWWFFDPVNSSINETYDERDRIGGARYTGPRPIPVMSAVRHMGDETPSEEGFYTLDTIEVRMSYDQARRAGIRPELDLNTDPHLKDRIGYEGRVFDITSIQNSGQYDPSHRYLTVLVLARRLRPDELVFDPDFKVYSA